MTLRIKSVTRVALAISCLLWGMLLHSCGEVVVKQDLEAMEQALNLPRGTQYMWQANFELIAEEDLHRIGFSKAVDMPELTLTRLDPPSGLKPVGMVSQSQGYLLDTLDYQRLYLYDYSQHTRTTLLDYRDSGITIGKELAFGNKWLVWLELGPFVRNDAGMREKEVRLVARDLSTDKDTVLDRGYHASAQGFFLPFDKLSLEGDIFACRRSVFSGGIRDTEIVYINLAEMRLVVLDRARGSSGRLFAGCNISGSQIVWDLQINFSVEYPGFPPFDQARYSIYSFETDSTKLEPGVSSLTTLTRNDFFFAPAGYRGNLIALRFWEPSIVWIPPPRGAVEAPYRLDYNTFDTAIVQITPQYGVGRYLVYDYEAVIDYKEYLVASNNPRTIQRSSFYIGTRLLSWQSSIPEQHLVYDLETYQILELPVYFGDAYQDEQLLARDVPVVDKVRNRYQEYNEMHQFIIYPNLAYIRVTPVPGAGADYLYFEHIYNLDPPYILVVAG